VRPRDWLILAVLVGAALWFGWPRIQDMPIVRTLRGECATPRSCPPLRHEPPGDWERERDQERDRGLRKT